MLCLPISKKKTQFSLHPKNSRLLIQVIILCLKQKLPKCVCSVLPIAHLIEVTVIKFHGCFCLLIMLLLLVCSRISFLVRCLSAPESF